MGTLRGNVREALRQLELLTGTGSFFFVHSGTGGSSNQGTDPNFPMATINQAVALCTANKGDVVVVMPGHAESVIAAGTVTIDKAGVTIVGLGNGTNKPVLTFGTATTATFLISAANVRVKNFRLVSDINDLATFFNVTADNCTIEDCDFSTSSTKEALCFVTLATTKDYLTIRHCKAWQPTDPAGTDGAAGTGFLYFVDSENILVENCFFYGNFESAIFHNKTTAAKNVWIRNCYGTQLLSGAEVFVQVAAMEGGVQSSFFVITGADDVTEAKTWGTMSDKFFIDVNSCVGNDGQGGQLGVAGATAAS